MSYFKQLSQVQNITFFKHLVTNVHKNLLYCDHFFLWIHYFLRFLCFHRSSIWHTWPSCVPSLHGCGWPFCLGLCFLNLLNCFHHWLFQLFFFLLINITLWFSWLYIFEHMFFSYFTSCGNINIHHIHICSDCLCFNNQLNLCYYHKFPMKHLLHFSKLWTIYHFMSIQTTNVACIWRLLMWFLAWLCYLCGCHCGMIFLLFACFHIVICHPIICAMFVSLPCITLCFHWC